ncbi:DUF5643 domain-containing protein [Jeotgalibacillus sp. R-1-5s-1]|uniref:DUF5643 domain-containing protein n=1 Tax=Jeotgalibacillus sp. R-1-5s-1 TaxID=2555897 RepID=UPI0010694F5A|nr:DUF5643 domain-containing protein [Jeotgalibacillus sp. R-1-5s-1]TFD94367.1 hypothetical protein E2491_13065 [Jeotgalibacillus sp. R-1-5s-1]
MNLERDSIKSAINSTPLPEDRLNQIINQSVFNHNVRKTKRTRYIKHTSAALLFIGLSGTLMFTTPTGQQLLSYLPFVNVEYLNGAGAGVTEVPEEAVYPLDETLTEQYVDIHFTEVSLSGDQVDIAYQQLVDPDVYSETFSVEAELFAIDDRGNRYDVPYNGGNSYYYDITREDLRWTATLSDLNPLAEKITFIPMATISYITDKPFEVFEYEGLEVDLRDGSVKIVESPGLPGKVYER